MQYEKAQYTEPNTAPRPVTGQFEDADDAEDNREVEILQDLIKSSHQQKCTKAMSLKSALKTKSIPPPTPLSRRISSNTTEATKALLGLASTTTNTKKKKKTFVVRLEEIKEYNGRHGRVPRRDPLPTDEPWEQNLLAWVQDCRRQFAEGSFSREKAKALADLGCEGFRIATTSTQPTPQTHPALQALWLKRQQEEMRLVQLRRASLGTLQQRRGSLDPDGATPTTAGEEKYNVPPTRNTKQFHQEGPLQAQPGFPNNRRRMSGLMPMQQKAVQSRRILEEMHARETLAREAIMREQLVMREQRLAQAMVAQRRLSAMGTAGAFATPGLPVVLPTPPHNPRVMSALLPPLDSVPPRADPMLSMGDPRFLMQAQWMQQRRASLAAQEQRMHVATRRHSDASGGRRSSMDLIGASIDRVDEARAGEAPPGGRQTWDKRMKEMWGFFLTHGHTNVSAAEHLGRWLSATRDLLREGRLPSHLAKEFQAIQQWQTWDKRMKEMWGFFLTHGHTNVSAAEHLGRWLSATRDLFREGLLPSQLAKEFQAMQQWTLGDADAASVDSTTPPTSNTAAKFRSMPKEALVTPTTPTKVKTFAASPKVRGKPKRALPKSWHQSFAELQKFKEKFGHCEVKMIVNSPYGLLGKWLASQRSRHKLGQLPVDKVKRLRDIGCNGFAEGGKLPHRSKYRSDDEEADFDQQIRQIKEDPEGEELGSPPCSPATREKRVRHSYETRVEHIKAFKAKHGHVKIRLGSSDKHEELLARWLASARSRYRGGQFREDRAEELRQLGCDGFETEDYYSDFENNDNAGGKKREYAPYAWGRATTPSPPLLDYEEGQGEPPSKKQRGGCGKRQSFDDMLKELESYQYVFGVGCSVPKPDGDKGKLGRWLAFQRRQFIAGKLSVDRIKKLRFIGRKEFNKSNLIVRAAERAAASVHVHEH